MKDAINCSYNGGEDTYLPKIVAIHFNRTVLSDSKIELFRAIKMNFRVLCKTS